MSISGEPDARSNQEIAAKNLETAYKEKFDEQELAGEQGKLDMAVGAVQNLLKNTDKDVVLQTKISLSDELAKLPEEDQGKILGLLDLGLMDRVEIGNMIKPMVLNVGSAAELKHRLDAGETMDDLMVDHNESLVLLEGAKTEKEMAYFEKLAKQTDREEYKKNKEFDRQVFPYFEYFGIPETDQKSLLGIRENLQDKGLVLSLVEIFDRYKSFIETDLVGIEQHENFLPNIKLFIAEKFSNLSDNIEISADSNRFILNEQLGKSLELDEIRDLLVSAKFYLNHAEVEPLFERDLLSKYGTNAEWIQTCNNEFNEDKKKIWADNTNPYTKSVSHKGKLEINKLYNQVESRKNIPDRERAHFKNTISQIQQSWVISSYEGESRSFFSTGRETDEANEAYATSFLENGSLVADLTRVDQVSFLNEEDQATEAKTMLLYLATIIPQLIPVVGDALGLVVDIPDIFSGKDITVTYMKEAGLVDEDFEMQKHGYDNVLALLGTVGAVFGLNEVSKMPKVLKITNKISKIPPSIISKLVETNPQLAKAFDLFKAFSKSNGPEAKKLKKAIAEANKKTQKYIEQAVAKNPNLDKTTLIKNMDANVTRPERIARTEELLGGMKLSPEQKDALLKAHSVPLGNNTEKSRILLSVFEKNDARKIMDAGLAGGTEILEAKPLKEILTGTIAGGLSEVQLAKVNGAHNLLLNSKKPGKTPAQIAKAKRHAAGALDQANLDPATRKFLEENVLEKSADELVKVKFPKVKVETSVEKVVAVKSPEVLLENKWGLSEVQLAKVNGAHNLLLNSKKPGKKPAQIAKAKRHAAGALDQANLDPALRKNLEENILGKTPDEINIVRKEGISSASKTNDVLKGEDAKNAEKALHRQKCIDYIQSAEVQHEIEKIFDGCDIPLPVRKKLTAHINKQALQQEIDNPEQYVGHGFGHSLNVKKQVENILDTNPQIIERMSEIYKISPEKSRMLSQLVAIYHDFGYPEVPKDTNGKSLGKALHAITGAEILKQDEFIKIFNECFTEIPTKSQEKMLSDLVDGVLFHSADKVEIHRTAKIKIAHGEFIIDNENIINVYNKFGGNHKNGEIEIEASAHNIVQIKEVLKHEGISESRFNFIETDKKIFSGRMVDLNKKDDEILGVEYRKADAMEDPLLFLVRMADNTDMTPDRFSDIQKTIAFRDVYHFMGEGKSGKLFSYLESVKKQVEKGIKVGEGANEKIIKKDPQEALKEVLSFIKKDPEITQLCKNFEINLDEKKSVDAIFTKLQTKFFDNIFSNPKYTEEIQKFGAKKMREILEEQNSVSFRHFGGCESIKNVELDNGTLIVKVSGQEYTKLNKTLVHEKFKVGDEFKDVKVGVGEYQVFRFMDANQSLKNGDDGIKIQIEDAQTGKILAMDFETEFRTRNKITK